MFNEEDAVPRTMEMLSRQMKGMDFPYEIIMVDDGSTDKTRTVAEENAKSYPDMIITGYPANRGRVMDRGFWRYTRHPNYFGDAVQWWAFFLLAASAPGGLWTLVSPLLMTTLLLRVSGVALLEEGLETSKPEYAAYRRRTSPFFPRPPREEPGN